MMADTIFLNSPAPKKKQNIFSRALDIISAPLSQPGTTFTKGLSAGAAAVKKSRQQISAGDKTQALKVVGTTLLSTGIAAGAVLGGGTAAGRAIATTAGKRVAAAAAKKPLTSLVGVGLATTAGGRSLLKEIPKKAFQGGRIAGKVLGNEDTGISSIGKALAAGGVVGGAAIGGKLLYDKITQGEKAKDVLPKQLGVAPPSVSPLLTQVSQAPQAAMGSGAAPAQVGGSAVKAPVIVQVTF